MRWELSLLLNFFHGLTLKGFPGQRWNGILPPVVATILRRLFGKSHV